jgi:hypothetical protein
VNPNAIGISCCDVINRGAFYADGKVIYNLLDGRWSRAYVPPTQRKAISDGSWLGSVPGSRPRSSQHAKELGRNRSK